MLADPRSSALVENFAGQWLFLRNLQSARPDVEEFPDFDDNLRQAMRRETELLFEHIMREDRSVSELLTADYTFVNERLGEALRHSRTSTAATSARCPSRMRRAAGCSVTRAS